MDQGKWSSELFTYNFTGTKYGMELWCLRKPTSFEQVRICLLKSIRTHQLQQSEQKQVSIPHSRSIIRVFTYWHRLHSMDPDRLSKICLLEQISMVQPTSWVIWFIKVISQREFFTQYLLSSASQARDVFKQRVLDISAQTDLELLAKKI